MSAGSPAISCVGVTNQRETAVLWDRSTLAAPRRAIVWQDRRTTEICSRLRAAGAEPRVAELTGLRLDPYFTATKLTWLAENEPAVWADVVDGSVVVGTVDSYLVARLSGGRLHVTDASNASRSLLFDLEAGQWSTEMCALFGVPPHALPEVVASFGVVGHTDPASFLGLSVPIAGIAGDQQAALFGQACFDVGATKCTYGTGSFVLVNTGSTVVRSKAGLLSTVAWLSPSDGLTYALEGSVFVTGAADSVAAGRSRAAGQRSPKRGTGAVGAGLRRGHLRSGPDRARRARLGSRCQGRDVRADSGDDQGAPDPRGARGHRVRGPGRDRRHDGRIDRARRGRRRIRSSCQRARWLGDAPVAGNAPALRVDGGASANDLLMQLQADQIQRPVERPVVAETTALGAAFLAGLATGVWSSQAEIAATWQLDRRFTPGQRDEAAHGRWRSAVEQTKGWRG